MNIITRVFRDSITLNPHKRAVVAISVAEVDFIKGFSIEALSPIWLDFSVFDFLFTGGDFVEPFLV